MRPMRSRRRWRGSSRVTRSSACRPARCTPARSIRFAELIPLARAHGAWVHIDGAFGLWAAASPSLRPLMDGSRGRRLVDDGCPQDAERAVRLRHGDRAGSGRFDRDVPHRRGLSRLHGPRPVGCHARSCRAARAACRSGRRCAASGRSGVAALVDRLHANAVAMADGLAGIPGVTVVNEVPYTQVMFRLDDDDGHAERSARRSSSDGTAVVTGAEWDGGRCCGARCRRGRRRPTTSSALLRRSAGWSVEGSVIKRRLGRSFMIRSYWRRPTSA